MLPTLNPENSTLCYDWLFWRHSWSGLKASFYPLVPIEFFSFCSILVLSGLTTSSSLELGGLDLSHSLKQRWSSYFTPWLFPLLSACLLDVWYLRGLAMTLQKQQTPHRRKKYALRKCPLLARSLEILARLPPGRTQVVSLLQRI